MRQRSGQEILRATEPSDIFTMNSNTIESEYAEYIERFKTSEEHKGIENFLITKQVTLLYRKAREVLSNVGDTDSGLALRVKSKSGKDFEFLCTLTSDIKLGKMYVTDENVVFYVYAKYKSYYENYVQKTKSYPKVDRKTWVAVEHMFPKVTTHFETQEGDYIIILRKPCEMFSLRELLEYFGGQIAPRYVASILTRLFFWECYMDLSGMTHNGIIVDNLFFSPGRFVDQDKEATIEDYRIVGIFGGWFFTTYANEQINGAPKAVRDIMPYKSKKSGYTSYTLDVLSIKQVAKELLGASADVPKPFKEWLEDDTVYKSAYEAYHSWNKVKKACFGKSEFVPMDISKKPN